MLSLDSNSDMFNYDENFRVNKNFLDHFFPYFIVLDQHLQTLDKGRLWSKLDNLNHATTDFVVKKNSQPLSWIYINEHFGKRIVLKHNKSGLVFFGEFISSPDGQNQLGILSPKIISTENASSLKISATDLPGNDNTLDSALIFQTQKILLQDNTNLIEELISEQQKIQNFNTDLEKTIEIRTHQLDEVRAQSINSAKLASLGEMASGIAHEILNPLAIISSSVAVLGKLQDEGALTTEKFNHISGNIKTTVTRISKIINSVRTLSQNSETDELVPIQIKENLKDVLNLYSMKLINQDVDLKIDLESGKFDVYAMADFVQLAQVFINLMLNAAAAIVDLKEKWIQVDISSDSRFHYVHIMDSGVGIPMEIQEKIFIPFFTTKSIDKGTGLGLALSKKIVEKFGGTLSVDNNSKNTCFVLKLVKA